MYMGLHAMAARMHTSRTTPRRRQGWWRDHESEPGRDRQEGAHRLTDSRGSEEITPHAITRVPRNYRPVSFERLALCRLRSHVRRARVTTRGALDRARCIAISLAGCRSCPPITRAPLW